MKSFIGGLLLWGMLLGLVSTDKECDDIIKKENVTDKYADSIGSTDLVVCYELVQIGCGEKYAPSLLEKRPSVYFDVGSSCRYVTIAFFGTGPDSDATTLLWIAYNVEAEDLKNGFTGQSGNEKVIYTKPKAAEGISDHFFFVYCQDDSMNTLSCCATEERQNFKPRVFAKNNKLEAVTAAVYLKVTATGQMMESAISKEGDKKSACRAK